MISIKLPINEQKVRELRVGDEVEINGTMITARDAAHKYLVEEKHGFMKEILSGNFIYHCGPVVKKDKGKWSFVAAGPTTSSREEPYEADVIKNYGVRGVIGKGGMGKKTLQALQDYGAVYLHAIGGLAVVLADSVIEVREVYKLDEFGVPEAMWVIEVSKFPAVVTMDSHGRSLHEEILKDSTERAKKILGR